MLAASNEDIHVSMSLSQAIAPFVKEQRIPAVATL
jgi:hypothetical protein